VVFAEKGAKVVAAARGGDALSRLVEDTRGDVAAVPTDVADPAAVYRLADEAERRFGRIDTWVNGAAVSVYARVEDTTDQEFEQVMRINFLGHVYGVHAALPALKRAGGGSIIGISSVEGERTLPLHGAYSASKRALRSLYDALRMELAEAGQPIAVTAILPASIDTPLFEHSRSKLGAMPKPPPPVYAPEAVAGAIVHASVSPSREVPVGGSSVGFIGGQRFTPALTDAVMSLPRIGFDTQRSDRPDDGVDNLDGPIPGPGQIHGSYPGRVLQRSLFTTLLGSRRRPGEVLLRAVAARQRHASR
jgi:NAD(P)-dependent dehydrogenase (short-subunit alcohol dehydrogenase family)